MGVWGGGGQQGNGKRFTPHHPSSPPFLLSQFDEAFRSLWNSSLKSNAHVVFNDSRVVKARCSADGGVEVLFLDPYGSTKGMGVLGEDAEGQSWR